MRRIRSVSGKRNTETGASTPCLKHFFRCLETSGTAWNDSQGGVVWNPPGMTGYAPLLFNQQGSMQTVQPVLDTRIDPSMLTSGEWPVFSTQSVLFMYAGRVNAFQGTQKIVEVAIGDVNLILPNSTGAGIGLSDNPFHMAAGVNPGAVSRITISGPIDPTTVQIVGGGATYASVPTVVFTGANGLGSGAVATAILSGGTSGAVTGITMTANGTGYAGSGTISFTGGSPTGGNAFGFFQTVGSSIDNTWNGEDIIVAGLYEPGTQMTYKAYQAIDPGSGTVKINADAQSSTINNAGTFQPFNSMRCANVAFYGLAIYAFSNGFPPDLDAGIFYNGGSWIQGNRYSYPGWIGLT